jgi:hypothetical protein
MMLSVTACTVLSGGIIVNNELERLLGKFPWCLCRNNF